MTFLQDLGLIDYSLLVGIQSKTPVDLNRPPTGTSLAELVGSLKRSSMSISFSRQKSPFNLLDMESSDTNGHTKTGTASADIMQLHLPPPDVASTASPAFMEGSSSEALEVQAPNRETSSHQSQ